jgi:hypothetical protein
MTAIEWYFKQMQSKEHFTQEEFDSIYEQAKEMEKQQIIEFTNDFIDKHSFGDYDGIVQKNKTVEDCYKEKFKNK